MPHDLHAHLSVSNLEAHSVSKEQGKQNAPARQEGAPFSGPTHVHAAHHGHVHAASCPCVTKEHTPPHALASLPVKIPALRPENSRHDCF